MIHDIISKLITLRQDFVPFMQIYMYTIEEIKAEALRNNFIYKRKKNGQGSEWRYKWRYLY